MHSIGSNLGVVELFSNPSSLFLKVESLWFTKDPKCDNDFKEVSMAYAGIGIGPDKLEKIFERFYQVEELTRKTD